ncbi:MAG: NAD-binding protein [Arhodomonas sp.]|nr:NAD-binding protein [Arhodomonas sp.]
MISSLLFFFIELGAKLDLTTLGAELNDATVFSVFVLVGNPLIVMAIMGFMGYRRRTGFMAGLTVAQISEFSIVFVAMGISLGHVGVQTLGLTTLVGLVTIALSSYMILYAQTLYEWVGPLLRPFERATPFREQAVEAGDDGAPRVEVIVFGLGRYGERLLERLAELGIPALGVDFDPEVVRRLRDHGLSARFGDAEDPAFLESLPLRGAEWVITTLPQWPGNRALLSALRGAGYAGQTAGAVRDELHGYALHRAGVDRVLNVFEDATEHAARLLATELRGEEVSDAPA